MRCACLLHGRVGVGDEGGRHRAGGRIDPRRDQIELLSDDLPATCQLRCRGEHLDSILRNLILNARDALRERRPADAPVGDRHVRDLGAHADGLHALDAERFDDGAMFHC